MIRRHSLRQLLAQLYQRKSDIESLICFFEKYGKQTARRRSRAKRYLRAAEGAGCRQNLNEEVNGV